jgi:hypothetical protein
MIDRDPVKDALFEDRDNILMIMKDGAYRKTPLRRRTAPSRVAAD